MIYLDYSATTPVNNEVLDTFVKATNAYIGNPNSLHKLGVESKKLIDASTEQISKLLNVSSKEIIYTSGATEANNAAILGVCYRYSNRGKHIITTKLEHSSITATLQYLQNHGYDIDFLETDSTGRVDLDNLKSLIRDDTILVTVASVNSEVGVIQPIEEIGNILKDYPKIYFHSDMTQSIGKINFNIENVDMISFSAQKIYGLKGIGCLIKKENIVIDPIIHGGKSTTIYRSGTRAVGLIVSVTKALRLVMENLDENYEYVYSLNKYLKDKLKDNKDIHINSNEYSIPHILNISVVEFKPETFLHTLEMDDVYISTKSACSSSVSKSDAVYAVTGDDALASTSIRISLSYKTTNDDIAKLLFSLKKALMGVNYYE